MKMISPQQMSDLEAQAYRDGSSQSDFMEEAGSGVALLVHDYIEYQKCDRHVILLCGKGNNAGDAYVAGIHLRHLDYEVTAYQLFPIEECSSLCRQNSLRFLSEGGHMHECLDVEEISFPNSGLIVDGIFGTGFKGKVSEFIAGYIQKANQSHLPIIAIDIPSGLNAETGEVLGEAIVAKITAFLGLPKTGFALLEGWNHVGKLAYVDFGMPTMYVEETESELILLTGSFVENLKPPLKRNRHKYEAGLVVGLAGSPNMPGAALLSSMGAFRGGAGLVKLLYPQEMQGELVSSPYELIKIPYQYENVAEVLELLAPAKATFIGPGLGRGLEVRKLLQEVIPNLKQPGVIDADALTMIAEEKLDLPPNQLVLTPHMGEMKRLLGIQEHQLDLNFLHTCKRFAADHAVTLVLKGGPTFIIQADQPIYVCPHGDPGMATAGSGDILTGLIAALLAQGSTPHHAAILGAYLHGLAGEYAAEELSSYYITASDILDCLSDAFLTH